MAGTLLASLGKLAIGVAPMAVVSTVAYVTCVVVDKIILKAYLKVGELVIKDTNTTQINEINNKEGIDNVRRAA